MAARQRNPPQSLSRHDATNGLVAKGVVMFCERNVVGFMVENNCYCVHCARRKFKEIDYVDDAYHDLYPITTSDEEAKEYCTCCCEELLVD